jgi:hypothetical protein
LRKNKGRFNFCFSAEPTLVLGLTQQRNSFGIFFLKIESQQAIHKQMNIFLAKPAGGGMKYYIYICVKKPTYLVN